MPDMFSMKQPKKVFGLTENQIAAMSPAVMARYLKQKYTYDDIQKMSDDDAELMASFFDEAELQREPFINVIDEQHPDLFIGTRLLIKNFGSDAGSVKALADEGFIVDEDPSSGDILIKKPGEDVFHRTETKKSRGGIGETALDIVDEGANLAQILAETGGAIAGGLKGGLPGAMAGSGGAAGLFNIARQGIGLSAGVRDEFSPLEVAEQSAWGLLPTALFGSGTTAKTALKYGAKKGLTTEAIDKLMKSQRGIVSRAFNAPQGVVGEALSGIPRDSIQYAKKPGNFAKMMDLARKPEGADVSLADLAVEKFNQNLDFRKAMTDQRMDQVVGGFSEKIDSEPIRRAAENTIAEANAYKQRGDPWDVFKQADLEAAEDTLKLLESRPQLILRPDGTKAVVPMPKQRYLSANEILHIKRSAAEIAKAYKTQAIGSLTDASKKSSGKTSIASHVSVGKAADDVLKKAIGEDFSAVNAEWRKLFKAETDMKPVLNKDPLTGLLRSESGSNSSRLLRKKLKNTDELLGTDLQETANLIQATDELARPGWIPEGGVGKARTTLGGLGGMYGGYYLGSNLSENTQGLGPIMGGAGLIAGAALTGAKGQRQALRLGNLGRAAGEKASALAEKGVGPFSIYNLGLRSPWLGVGQETP